MTQELNPRCIQLDDVADPETYVDLMLEGHLPLQEAVPTDSGEAPSEG